MQNTHLRTYVKKHPDNKMAWYLLGKEYLGEGQEAKANYCFQQAGEVYEAFERSKAPADIWVDYQEKLVEMSEQKEKKQRRRKMWLTLLMLLVLAGLPPADAPGFSREAADALSAALESTDDIEAPVEADKQVGTASIAPSNVFTAAAFGGGNHGEAALAAAWSGSGPKVETSAVLGMQTSDDWSLWKRNMPVKYIVQTNTSGKLTAQSYDAKQCNCEPPEITPKIKKMALAWTAKQEAAASLSSAIVAYRKKNDAWPKSVTQMAQPFPNNILGETASGMTEMFPKLLALHQGKAQEGKNDSSGKENGSTTSNSSQGKNAAFADTLGGQPFLQEPLEIVIDKDRHKLALISGDTIVRMYDVGLGGDRTPEGSFVITDKVVNPNGRSNGEFGSRGMQLSNTNYAIHGTNEPDSIGLDESLGCVRMRTGDVEELFALAPQGTPVRIGEDVLPDLTLVPEAKQRYQHTLVPKQNNPNKTYHWLN
ncbi:L,D-transpeptidase [Paenibacillus sp. BGI2013]|uniref:L,D-transpeptidase family protein n=1 Tax=Paenibacillus TaxID=44249 RepID=UPI000C6E91E0|nr:MULTISPECIES: L,D-transpeptidase family protein [Paenibacillus]MCP1425954.1 lipoprotein-anchoring transpeptidase ErfK/SrfK [Paenibacillus xylanexedens]PKQ92921.1 L,D-transpeptidase [Paenibacillus sp. BGI2013]